MPSTTRSNEEGTKRTIHRLTFSHSVSSTNRFLASKNLHQTVVYAVLSKFPFQVVVVFHKCLVALLFYYSTTVVCILISTIPHKWVRLGFNCLFLVFHVLFSSVLPLLSVWITLLCSTTYSACRFLNVQYLNLEKYFHQFVRCHGVMFDWLILLTVTVFLLVVCFPLEQF